MLVKSRNINQIAYLTALGAKLIDVEGAYPNNTFVVDSNRFLLFLEKHVGLIPYRKYCNQRIRLKERGRKLAKLPKKFVGKEEGFKFGDIARVTKLKVAKPFDPPGDLVRKG
jgi:hypothetical protein